MKLRTWMIVWGLIIVVAVVANVFAAGATWPKDRKTYTHKEVELMNMVHDGHYFIVAVAQRDAWVTQQRTFSHSNYRTGTGVGVSLVHHPDCPCRR